MPKFDNDVEMADEVETSDDDYIDPSIEKYFKKKADKKADKKTKEVKEKKKGKVEVKESEDEDDDDIDEYEENNDDDVDEEDEEDDEQDEEDEKPNENGITFNEENDDDGRIKLTLPMIKAWSNKLSQEKPFGAINETVRAFKSALRNVIPNKKVPDAKYRVEGPEMFNAVVRLCMRDMVPCILKLLNLTSKQLNDDSAGGKLKPASSGSHWKKLKIPIKSYLEDLLALTNVLNEPEVLNSILKHLRLLVNFYVCFPKLLKLLMKTLITIWSQSDEKSRVIAFVCLHKIASNSNETYQDFIFKNVYLSFARNSKFTSINTLPMINFMQRSLVEIYATNVKLAYDHMFIYIRQLAIHLRNAMNSKKKDTYQAVYNWQFVHSLSLWSKVLGEMVSRTSNEYLIQLIYPLTQVIMGTIKLIPTPRYYPLRFHCINALTVLSNSTGVFMPILPFILEVFDITDFNKKHSTISVKQLNFSFLLKLNKQQLQDKSFKDVLIDTIYDSLILLLQNQSYDIAFPELALPLTIRIKEFLKKSKNGNYSKVMKGLLDKVQENSKFIEDKRSKATFSLADKKAVDHWMDKNKEAGTPLSLWYTRYKTLREREIMMEVSNKEMISKNRVPVIERPSREQHDEEKKEFAGLFVSDDDDDSDSELLDFVPKKKKKNENTGLEDDVESEDDFEEAINGKFDAESDEDEDGEKMENGAQAAVKKYNKK